MTRAPARQAENARLKKALAKHKAELAAAQAEIARIKAKGAAKASKKAAAPKPTPKAKPAAKAKAAAPKPTPAAKAKPSSSRADKAAAADILAWTQQTVGDATGSGLDAKARAVLESEGPDSPALVKLLADKYLKAQGKRPAAADGDSGAKKARK